jgi:hypothetical protein
MYIHPDLDYQLIRQGPEDVLRDSAPPKGEVIATSLKSRLGRIVGQIKQTWTEFDHAQRRLIEIQLSVPTVRDAETESRATIAALEAMYSRPSAR